MRRRAKIILRRLLCALLRILFLLGGLPRLRLILGQRLFTVRARAAQIAALLDGAAADPGREAIVMRDRAAVMMMGLVPGASRVAVAMAVSELISLRWRGSSEVRDVLWDGMAGSDAGDTDVGGFSGLAEGVVA